MMYLRTHNASIASYLSPPQTEFQLEYIRPDLLLLRLVARNLVMWDNVLPTFDWAEGKENMPQIVRDIKENIPGMKGREEGRKGGRRKGGRRKGGREGGREEGREEERKCRRKPRQGTRAEGKENTPATKEKKKERQEANPRGTKTKSDSPTKKKKKKP
jgi:hypothetical protein